MLKKIFIFFSIFLVFTTLFSAPINRKILVLTGTNLNNLQNEEVHAKLATILNYYGYFIEHVSTDLNVIPENLDEYAGFIFWNYNMETKDPLKLINFMCKFKNKKNIIIGTIPFKDLKQNSYFTQVNEILKKNFGFSFTNIWSKDIELLKTEYDKNLFNFEKKISFLTNKTFSQVITHNKDFEVVYKETLQDKVSDSVFFAPWGFYGTTEKIFYNSKITGSNKWIINPFKMVEKVYNNNYPIPEFSTKNGKRIASIHIDGDGILSKSFNQKYTIENGLEFLRNHKIKTGVSFIAAELDKDGPIFKNPKYKDLDPDLFNENAKKIFSLPFVEPASHTYTHPFNWRKGMVAYSINSNAQMVDYTDKVKAYQEPDMQVNLKYEIDDSINYLQKLIPNKRIKTIYWTGDCYPSLRDLKYIDNKGFYSFNGGDSRFDIEFDSYSYTTPIGLYSKIATQIYSSNSNENTYTDDWSGDYWRYKHSITTFENTGFPKRIKPISVYFHFYSFAQKGSYNALEEIYQYLKGKNYEFLFPSEYIKIAKNFHTIKINEVSKNKFIISNIEDLREFKIIGKHQIISNDILNTHYNSKLDLTFITIKDNIKTATIEII